MALQGLRVRIILGLSLVFVSLALWLVPWTLNLARDHFLNAHQQVNREVARAVAEHSTLFQEGEVNQKELQGVFMKLMAVNPTLELYLLDQEGNILGYDAPPEAVVQERVDLAAVDRFLESQDQTVFGPDPRRPEQPSIFTAWPVDVEGERLGYVYAVLRNQSLEAATTWGVDGPELQQVAWALGASVLLALVCAVIIVSFLTRGVRRVRRAMSAFEEGDHDVRCDVQGQDEVGQLALGFNYLASSVQEQMEQVQQGDRKRREMIASISHDLRTPLASLRGYLEHLSERWPELEDARREEVLEIAMRNTDRVQRMTEDLLELSKLESGSVRLQLEDFPIGELVHDLVQRFRPEAKVKGIRLEASVPQNLSYVHADISLMERAIGNLVANALRHTARGGRVAIRVVEESGFVEVRVVDNGEGISAEELPRIFERFYRVAKNREVSDGSTGLGLAIVKQILSLHRSTIQVKSQPAVGTLFRFRLAAVSFA